MYCETKKHLSLSEKLAICNSLPYIFDMVTISFFVTRNHIASKLTKFMAT
jgi:hypothetical protein